MRDDLSAVLRTATRAAAGRRANAPCRGREWVFGLNTVNQTESVKYNNRYRGANFLFLRLCNSSLKDNSEAASHAFHLIYWDRLQIYLALRGT